MLSFSFQWHESQRETILFTTCGSALYNTNGSYQIDLIFTISWPIRTSHLSSTTVGVLARGAQWMAFFEAKHGLEGEGGLGKPHTSDE